MTEVESTLAVEPEEVASSWTTAEEVASSWSLHPALGDKVSDLAPEPRLHAHVRGRRARGGERLDVLGRGHQLVPLDEAAAKVMVACSNDTRPFDTAARMAVNLVSGVISKMDPGAGRRTSCTTAWRCAREKGVVFCVLCVACACAFVLSGATVVVYSLGAACRAIPAGLPVPWL